MKKLLFIFLIAIITASNGVQQKIREGAKIKELIKRLSTALYKLYLYLVDHSLWMDYLDNIQNERLNDAIELCVNSTNLKDLCTSLSRKIYDFYFN